jgi:hypothetical protein
LISSLSNWTQADPDNSTIHLSAHLDDFIAALLLDYSLFVCAWAGGECCPKRLQQEFATRHLNVLAFEDKFAFGQRPWLLVKNDLMSVGIPHANISRRRHNPTTNQLSR